MSGPKYSQVELEKLEAERIERERQEKLRIMREELEAAKNEFRNELDLLDSFLIEVSNFNASIDENVNSTTKNDVKTLLEDIFTVNRNISGDKAAILRRKDEIYGERKKLKARWLEIVRQYNEAVVVSKMVFSEGEGKHSAENVVIAKSISYDKYYEVFSEIENLSQSGILFDDLTPIVNLKNRLKALMEQSNNDAMLEIEKIYKMLISSLSSAKRRYYEMMSYYDDYVIKCGVLGIQAVPIEEFNDSDDINKAAKNVERAIYERDKMLYISECIEDVMEEMGHDIVRSDVFDEDSEIYNTDYYKFDDDGAICVTHSESGAIVMQVAVLGDETEMTKKEHELAMEKMISFCSQYPEIAKNSKKKE